MSAAFLIMATSVLSWPAEAAAQHHLEGAPATAAPTSFRIDAVLVSEAPNIDGSLDEPLWSSAALVDAFLQQEPSEGAPATERTEVRVLYDGSALFIAVRAFDTAPDGPIATELRRDSDRILDEDNFQIILDTYRDSRSAYMFVVSPLGAQLDQQVFDDGGRDRRASARAVNRDWDGVWAAAAQRVQDGWVAEIAIPMVNMRFPAAEPQSWGINFKRVIRTKNEEVYWAPIPRAFDLTRVSLAGQLEGLRSLDRGLDLRIKPYAAGGGRWQREGIASSNTHDEDFGVDVKYGILPGLSLDATYNTDFAQAEVDNEQVNLTRFALFYPEKREFFLENAGLFAVGTTNSSDRIADLFFSRRIGITSSRATVPLFGGLRLTGKTGGNNIAVMDIQTESLERGDGSTIEPGQNFLVARYSRDLPGQSQIGALVINKEASSGGAYNRTYATDLMLAFTPAFTVEGFVAKTESPHLDGRDWAGHLRTGWLSQSWRVYGEYSDLDRNFNPEVGFVPRVGVRRTKLHLEYNPRPGRWGIRMMEPMWNVTMFHDHSGRLVSREFHYMVGTRFENGANFTVIHNRYQELLDSPYNVARDITVDPGEYNFWDLIFRFSSNTARRLSFNASYSPQRYWDGTRTDWGAGLDFRATDQLAASTDFSRNRVDLPGGAFTADVASFRVDYGFSPRLSLRTLTQYNSLTDQLSLSGRIQYEYLPGSDIYLVYDEVRREDPISVSPFMEQFRDRQLLLKVTYLFSM